MLINACLQQRFMLTCLYKALLFLFNQIDIRFGPKDSNSLTVIVQFIGDKENNYATTKCSMTVFRHGFLQLAIVIQDGFRIFFVPD